MNVVPETNDNLEINDNRWMTRQTLITSLHPSHPIPHPTAHPAHINPRASSLRCISRSLSSAMAASARRLQRFRFPVASTYTSSSAPSFTRLARRVESECLELFPSSVQGISFGDSGVLASLRRFRCSSPSSSPASCHSSLLTSVHSSESDCADRVEETGFRVSGVLGGFGNSLRFGSSGRIGGWPEGLGIGDRGFAAKAKKSGGKARNDDGGGQVLATPGPSAKETATRLMEAAVNALFVELSKLRTGRASPGMLDHVNVTSHGVHSPLSHVAAVSVSNLETLTVMPYDASMVKEVEKAIRNSPLKLNPVEEGEVLRVPIPKLTKEHIQTMSKLVGKAGETAKLSVRRGRKDAMDIIAKGGFSKDEVKRYEKEVEEVTKKYVKSIEENCKSKEKEILGNS